VIITVLLSFSFQVTLLSPIVYAQSIEQVNEDIGGSGSSTSDGSGSDNTFLYIAAGVIIVSLIVWKVISDKKKPKTDDSTKPDSTKTSLKNYFFKDLSNQESELQKIRNQMPVELFLGWKTIQQNVPGENLSLGLKFKL
jgi:hypothetical protein